MKFMDFFGKKKNKGIDESLESRKKSVKEKREASDRLIDLVDHMRLDRRCGVQEYHGPERRISNT